MERKGVLGFLAGAVVGAALGRWWPDRPPEPVARSVSPAAVSRRPPVRLHRSVPPAPPSPTAAPVATGPLGPHASALRALATQTGDAVLRCDVTGLLPDGAVVGLPRARVEGGELLAMVDEARGDGQLRLPDDLPSAPPRAVVRWWSAWDEGAGCEALWPEEVLVEGVVVDPAGRPVAAEVGNVLDGASPTGPDGAFTHRCWRGSECPLGARGLGEGRWGSFQVVDPDAAIEVRLVLEPPRPALDLRGWLQQRVEDDVRLAAAPDPLRLAMHDPDLSDEGRAMLEAWLDEQAEERATHRSLLDALP